jgi:predicted component of type VI protein secretion system
VLGHAQIVRVYPNFSAAVYLPLPDTPRPRASDGARITRARVRVAITPVYDMTATHGDVRRVPYMVAAALEGSKRFQVVDPLAVSDMFATGGLRVDEMLVRPERSTRAARHLQVSGWIVPMLLERRGVTYLDVTYISAVTGTALISRRLALVTANAAEEQRFPWEPRPED